MLMCKTLAVESGVFFSLDPLAITEDNDYLKITVQSMPTLADVQELTYEINLLEDMVARYSLNIDDFQQLLLISASTVPSNYYDGIVAFNHCRCSRYSITILAEIWPSPAA